MNVIPEKIPMQITNFAPKTLVITGKISKNMIFVFLADLVWSFVLFFFLVTLTKNSFEHFRHH